MAALFAAHAGAADQVLVAVPGASARGELYLEVKINGHATGSVMRFSQTPAGLRCAAADLLTVGIDPGLDPASGARQGEYDLRAVPGLTYVYDAAAQSVDLHVADRIRTPFLVETRPLPVRGAGSATPGAVFNYDLYSRVGPAAQTSGLTELRLFNGSGVFSSTAMASISAAVRKAVRYDTSWSRDDPDTLTSVQVGDFISRSVPWSRSVRMGGVEWRKNFDLRPDMLTYPVPELKGSAVVPSNVSLYVNQMQQYTGAVPDGPFVLNQVAGLNGAGQATVVTRDALGRETAASIPLYIDTRLLAPGYDDLAAGLGALRRHYGERSFAYAPQLAATGSLRHGWTDSVTVEGHVEGSSSVLNAGAGILLRASTLGVVSASLVLSRADLPATSSPGAGHGGAQGSVGYQYLSPQFAVDLQSTRASSGHADLGSIEGTPIVRGNDRATVHVAMSQSQNISFSYVGLRQGGASSARIAALAWSMRLTPECNLNVNAYSDLDKSRARGLSATLSFALPGRTGASATAGSQGGVRSHNVSIARAGEVAATPGWAIQQGAQGGNQYAQAQVQYTGSTAQYSATVQQDGGRTQAAFGVSGSLVAMNGRLLPARQTGAAFALVSTGMPNVMVLQENRAIGRTDRYGDLLVPDLVPYSVNRLGIDADELPAEAQVTRSSVLVVPRRLSGVLAPMTVQRYDAATLKVVDRAGRPVPSGAAVDYGNGDAPSVVGYDGIVFVPHVKERNTLTLAWQPEDAAPQRCVVRFVYDSSKNAPGATLGPLNCVSEKDTQP